MTTDGLNSSEILINVTSNSNGRVSGPAPFADQTKLEKCNLNAIMVTELLPSCLKIDALSSSLKKKI
jgi:hypothetical protein